MEFISWGPPLALAASAAFIAPIIKGSVTGDMGFALISPPVARNKQTGQRLHESEDRWSRVNDSCGGLMHRAIRFILGREVVG
ncbi:MAG: hypothetical protein DCC75_09215 [Proteobacteria bacterium]|nr:MAG: hypothetical protein DCC75_09215 [Pseudomonadota bacterium]